MTHATTARTIDRNRLRSRFPVAPRCASPENAPVLFRLPVIVVAEDPVTAESSPAKPIPSPSIELSALSSDCSLPTAATGSLPPVDIVTELSSTDATSKGESNVASQSKIELSAAAGSPVLRRSWWEHWSSGVVLILLIIALVTASILAMNDGGKGSVAKLAGESKAAALDEFDLSNVTIPDIVTPNASLTGAAEKGPDLIPVASTVTTTIRSARPIETAPQTESTAQSKTDVASVPAVRTEATAASSTKAEGETAQAPQITPALPVTSKLAANTADAAKKKPTDKSADQSSAGAPLASLALPVGVAPLPLFDPSDNAHTSLATPASTSVGVPSLTVSGSTAPPAPIAIPNTAPTTPVSQGKPGSSPTFYDGAAVGGELPVGPAVVSGPADTNLPSYAMILASATQPVANPTDNPSQENNPPPAATPAESAMRSAIVPSATPDLDSAAIMNAYRHYSEMNQGSSDTAVKRYPTAATATMPSAPSTSPAPAAGFTLGNPDTR